MNMPKGPNLAVVPVAKEETSGVGPQILQPSGWPVPKGYANGMAADGRLRRWLGGLAWRVLFAVPVLDPHSPCRLHRLSPLAARSAA